LNETNEIKETQETLKHEAISHAEKKEFSKFADKVKTSLEDKLRNNPIIQKKSNELKNLQKMKDTFAQIEKIKKEPVEPAEPTEPQEEQE